MSRRSLSVDVATLRELLAYDAVTGSFVWNHRPRSFFKSHRDFKAWNTRFASRPAGRIKGTYVCLRIFGVDFLAHRVAWAIHYGCWPTACIDHRDGIGTNNSIANLRDVSYAINNQNNRIKRSGSPPLPMGVFFCARSKIHPFYSSIKINGKNKYLGAYPTPELAHESYLKEKRLSHPGCTL